MGILRTFLALCVLVEHSGGTIFGVRPLPGLLAVQGFYIISGFYMALVLTEKYARPGGLRRFYMARAKRLYPIYWTVLAATIFFGLILEVVGVPNRLEAWTSEARPHGLLLVAAFVSNIVMFGLDWLRLTMTNTQENAGALIVVVQSWTLGLELTFYLCAPLLVRLKTHWLVLIAAASFSARVIVYSQGPVIHVWTNSFFPFELTFFVSGMLAYRTYAFARANPAWSAALQRSGSVCLMAIIAFGFFAFEGSPSVEFGWGPLRNWVLLAAIAVALPALFHRFGSVELDDAVGQFSYPIYMLHFLVLTVVMTVSGVQPPHLVYIVLPLTVAGCVGLIRIFETPTHRAPQADRPNRRPVSGEPAEHNLPSEASYPVLVTEHKGRYTLCIRELFLAVSGTDLQQTYDELSRRRSALADWNGASTGLDELPSPSWPPLLLSAPRPIGFYRGAVAALNGITGRRAPKT